MDLPTPREVELETLLRQRDSQVSELGDEVKRLRQYLTTQPGPSTTDAIYLPPSLTSILLPQLNNANSKSAGTTSASGTLALTQRTRLLQEENDELYDLLKQGETGKLKEEVRGLRRLVQRLEGALRESHQVVQSLSTELDKSYETIMTAAPRAASSTDKSQSQSPRTRYNPLPTGANNNGGAQSKLPPTGPRAHKKPRLSEPHPSPPPRTSVPPLAKPHPHPSSNHHRATSASRERSSPRAPSEHRRGGHVHGGSNSGRMEVDRDEEQKPRARTPVDRSRDRDRERDRPSRERDRDRDRYRDGGGRRNGFGGGGRGGGGGRRSAPSSSSYQSADRTLKERLGL
ncbi:hypothetical protein C8J57DRAFT_1294057 [Mycena rebaudengoi]|nr:hypothetical protein C8J57DRAFT_1294057 [Mycena rebaudengoi]